MALTPTIPRDVVHRLSEACAEGPSVQLTAKQAIDGQARLLRFFKANLPQMAAQPGEVSLYLLSVVVRVFQGAGGRLDKATPAQIEAATAKIRAHGGRLLPGDDDFPTRVRAVEDRAQPHLLDEALHALFEREKNLEREIDLAPDQAALIFLMLWAATEALNLAWTPPAALSWDPPPSDSPAV